MVSGFTIDGTVYPAQSGTTVNFDRGVAIENSLPKRVNRFGDGYSLHIPIGPVVRKFNVAFLNRASTEITIIETYFELLEAGAFDITMRGETITVICKGWGVSYQQEDIWSLNAVFEEYFDS